MSDLRRQWNNSCLNAGLPSLSLDTSARIMAVLLHYGNNEAMVLCDKFRADCEYVQKKYRITGGGVPDTEFVCRLKQYDNDLHSCTTPPLWAKQMMKEMSSIDIF